MRFARNSKGKRIEVSFSKEEAYCPGCNSVVYGRKGRFVDPYWRHPNNSDCDSWNEPITKWHIDWQNNFPEECQEISLVDKETGELHRADVKLYNNLVIEIQNSPIKPDEIEQREDFYGTERLIWILNGKNLAKQSEVFYYFEEQICAISVEIPSFLDGCNYEMDDINMEFWSTEFIKESYIDKRVKKIENQNGYYYWFEFNTKIDFDSFIEQIQGVLNDIIINLYGRDCYYKIMDQVVINTHFVPYDRYYSIDFEKKYWRKFIDLMKFPVLFDNIKGLDEDLLYWYQENRIISKKEFLKNIMINKNWLKDV